MKNMNVIKLLAVLGLLGLLNACASTPPPAEETTADSQPAAEEPVVEETVSAPQNDTYLVVRGDSLWKISGKPDIYGNPYQWPLIYKANRDKIKDADLIYPGQELTIERGASEADRQAAIDHAKTRGAWSLGTVESSDEEYLNQ
jgi:hypothetical protein